MEENPPKTEQEIADRQVAYSVLNDVFSNINDQLRFAETKNGAIVTLDLAIVLAIASVLSDHLRSDDRLPIFLEDWFLGVGLWLTVAALVALVSFIPEMKPRTATGRIASEPNNIFFFGHIVAWTEDEFLARVFGGLGLNTRPLPAHRYLANQIGSNSQNAQKKFTFFAVAAAITLTAVGISTVLLCGCWLIWGI